MQAAELHRSGESKNSTRGWVTVYGPWVLLLILVGAIYAMAEYVPWAFKYPRDWIIPLSFWISDAMKWLYEDASFGLFTFKELTRGISWLLEWPLTLARNLLSTGFMEGQGSDAVVVWPRLTWVALTACAVLIALAVADIGLALFVAACFLYLVVFGQWESAMVTSSSIVIAVPLGVFGGLALGVAAHRHPLFKKILTPILDLMQTVPVFAYLVPILVLFGFSPVAAMIATMIYALPPMVRNTMLALQRVPSEIVDFGHMAGCSRRQMMWKVMIPSARSGLMVGVNQVIMLSLNMVIIASMIGAGGLGRDVLTALRRLDFGAGLEASIAITLIAIALDRVSQAFAHKPPPAHGEKEKNFLSRNPYMLMALAIIVGTWILSTIFPAIQTYPESWQITSGAMVNDFMQWLNINFFDTIEAVKSWLLIYVMIPFKRFLLALPWVALLGAVALSGYRLGGVKLALLVTSLVTFIVVTGQWPKAMVTLYLCGMSVFIASAIGIPIGIWSARHERVNRVVQVVIDTLQTLPAFAYLMPVVMLFRVGDFAAMLAVIAYSLAPAIRYSNLGIRQVDPRLIEAATAVGCNRRQLLWKVQLPLALPEIMLGINQTIMLALSMLVITALVGTRDLGQEVYIALTKADIGRGVVAGVCVAFIAITADRLISPWSERRKNLLGIG
ncbi:ABC transporter permease subunit [Gammaproteobacteria bacterium]|nr:ABC transporter permease subunit [Gammaproteobacteria bacterium]